jgi:hypothetical protein
VVSILRDNYDGRLIIQMGDQAYRTLADAPEAKQRFMAIMKELADIVTKPDTRASAAPAERPEPAAEPGSQRQRQRSSQRRLTRAGQTAAKGCCTAAG